MRLSTNNCSTIVFPDHEYPIINYLKTKPKEEDYEPFYKMWGDFSDAADSKKHKSLDVGAFQEMHFSTTQYLASYQ